MSLLHRAIGAGTALVVAGGSALLVAPGADATPVVPASEEHEHHGHVAEAYTLELLAPTNGGVTSSALGINDLGDVVGITRPTSSAQPQRTVLWERHDDHFHAHELANLEGSQFSRGFDLNDDREIVGEAFNAGGGSIPIRWSGDAAPVHVTTLNEAGTGILNDIADDGVAVGTASGKGVRVAADGSVAALAAPATGIEGATVKSWTATAVAEGEVIGGRATVAVPHGDHTHDELRGVVWESGAGRLLTTPDGGSSPVVAQVTPEGEAIGSVTIGGKETAIVWSPTGTAEALALPGVADFTHASAKASADDVAVGSTTKFAGTPSFGGAAVAWDAHGPVDLNSRVVDLPAGVELQAATDINEAGQIAGSAKTADGGRGFVLTPVPDVEPEPVATTVTAAAVRQVYGKTVRVPVTVTPAEGGEVSATVGGTTRTAPVVAGRATLVLPARSLAPGARSVTLAYSGVEGQFAPAQGAVAVRVIKADPAVRVSVPKTVKRGRTATVRVTAKAAGVVPTGRVVVRVAGRTRTVRLTDGRASVTVRVGRKVGGRQVVVRYAGDRYVAADRAAIRFRVTR